MSRLPVLILALIAAAALVLPPFLPDPLATDAAHPLHPPGPGAWFGTDHLGRDILARTVAAGRLDLSVALAAVALSATAGTALGLLAGWRGGWGDAVAARSADLLMAFPLFVLTLVLVALFGNSPRSVVLATALVNLPFYFRLARAETRIRRGLGYVEAARAGGSGTGRILGAILLPSILPVIAVQASVNLGWAVMNVAGLSFLGLGVRPPAPEWGVMVAEGARYMASGEWWLAAFPGLALALTVLSCNLAGDVLADRLREAE